MKMKEISKKLLDFQMKVEAIKKDGKNVFFKKPDGKPSTYATLNNIIAEIKPILNDLGLVLTQPIGENGVNSIVTDTETGETMVSSIPLPSGLNPQQMGSAITYYRRYTLVSLLSLETEEDDDANSAQNNKSEDNRPWLSEKQLDEAIKRIKDGDTECYANIFKAFRMKKQYKDELNNLIK